LPPRPWMVSALAVPFRVSPQEWPSMVAAMATPESATIRAATVRTAIAVRFILLSFCPVLAGPLLGPVGLPVRASSEGVSRPGEGTPSRK
jgi:hypothetical protein